MKHLKYILFIMIAMMLSSSSCASKKSIENCEIKEVLKATAENDDLYYMHIKFSHCASKELRENLIKEELRNRFPLIGNRTIYVEEYLGKMYNEYKYEIKVEDVNIFGQVRDFNDIPKDILKQLGKMGVDDSLHLNSYESAYLNIIFAKYRGDFDFTDKKVGFIKISGDIGKIHYFDMQEKHFVNEHSPCDNGSLYIFDAAQKKESGGYDAAIIYWSKFVIPIENVVKWLKKQR